MRDLTGLLTNDEASVTLDRAALDIARLEYPDLDPAPWLTLLDDIAMDIATQAGDLGDNRRFIQTANTHLFRTLGFKGNSSKYYDIRNSCLNDVLDRRLGIPITLSLVYMEVARRLAKPVAGIGLPSHFLVRFDDGDLSAYIDPFAGGRILSKHDCVKLVLENTGAEPSQQAFVPFTPKLIALRMLQNMKGIYVGDKKYEKALRVFELILASGAHTPEEYKQRAVVYVQMRRLRAAREDFETYLSLAPDAPDRSEVLKQLAAIHRYGARLN